MKKIQVELTVDSLMGNKIVDAGTRLFLDKEKAHRMADSGACIICDWHNKAHGMPVEYDEDNSPIGVEELAEFLELKDHYEKSLKEVEELKAELSQLIKEEQTAQAKTKKKPVKRTAKKKTTTRRTNAKKTEI